MKQPHKHAALIHAWAGGAEIEMQLSPEVWIGVSPGWDENSNYRIKPVAVPPPERLNVEQMMFSAMQRFIQAVDDVMGADDLDARERRDLICYWAYRYKERDMPEKLKAAISRCQVAEFVHPTASSMVDWVSGEIVPFSQARY